MALAGRGVAPPARPLIPAEAWLLAGLLGAVACVAAAVAAGSAAWAAAAAGSLAAGAVFYEQRLLGPLLALALPLEITKLAFPFLLTREELGGGLGETSIVDAGRLVVALAFVVWLLRPGRPRAGVWPASPLTLPLAMLFAVYALSTAWAFDAPSARTETLRLVFSLGMFALVPFFVRDGVSLRWTLLALVASAGALAVVGVYQQVTGDFLWNEGLGEFGERRINTTFADPNHFARFLVTAIVLGLALWPFSTRTVRWRLLAPCLALSLLTLVFTGSRGAWVAGGLTLPLAVMILPTSAGSRLKALGAAVAGILVVAVIAASASPFFAKRLDTFTFGVEALGARPYLVEAGLAMFRDHPLTGVGAGGFQAAFEEDYWHFKDPKIKADITASHTSAITVVAELGLIGAVAAAFLVMRTGLYVRDVARAVDPERRAYARALGIALLVVALGSQTEGRFFEDPYLWLFAGLVVAIDRVAAAQSAAVGEDGAP